MKANLRTTSLGGLRMTSVALSCSPSGHILWLVTIRYCLGFTVARRAMTT